MKHSILTYSLLAAAVALSAGCNTADKAPAEKPAAPVARTPAKPVSAKPAPAPKKLDPAAQKRAEEAAKRKAEAEAKKKAEAEFRAKNAELSKEFEGYNKKRMTYATRIAEVKKLMKDPQYADTRFQLRLNEQIIRYCQNPPWTTITQYDYSTADTELPPAALWIIRQPGLTPVQKKYAQKALAIHYCDRQMYDKAEALLKESVKTEKLHKNDVADLLCTLATVYKYQDKYSEAMAACREAMKYNAETGAAAGANIALGFGKKADAVAIWNEAKTDYGKLRFFASHLKKEYLNEALAFVKNEANKPNERLEIAHLYLFDSFGTQEISSARRTLTGLPAKIKSAGWWWTTSIKRPFQLGDYPLTVELCEIFAGAPVTADVSVQKIHVIALGATGKKAEAAGLAAEYAKNDKLKPVDAMRFKFYEAILSGRSTDGMLERSTLTRKEQSAVLLSAARQCLTWNLSGLAEKYSAAYDQYFAEKPNRVMTVRFSDTPVSSIAEWRKRYPSLDKQVCNIPFKGSMDFLETDVATGDRSVNFEKNSKNTDRMDVSAICDRDGLHIFLHVVSAKARSIERGFANGIGTELYFAPGRNQPYVCMGSEPRKGVTFMFQTTYSNMNHKRPDMQKTKKSFRDEVEFTDTDYVLHMFFAWDDYYNKLPANGTEYRFECISWCPDGGFSWGGSQGVHGASEWGSLKFELTDKQLNAIRRNLIFRYYRNYASVPRDPGTSENLFGIWEDPEIGDPDFYKTMLEPLKKKLTDYAAMVREDMSDEDVAKVYTEALPLWMGLLHEVDRLRRIYLNRSLCR